ncbi:hypothetical protein GSI_12116 [Ganoderma sinense ZZ0214-1]|uniref:Uncharacterized protein n=1 Tax=Ganoderma sinense ZZ0214-1 TaxID=1077348 RepID=A0A2G8RXW7_9APHY|nr:hypothetical protein GSI_12116 [Ganoderma sinense ZZ0214-1]
MSTQFLRRVSDVGLVSATQTLPLPFPPNHQPPPAGDGDVVIMPDPEMMALASDIRELSLILSANDHNWRPPQPNQGPVQDDLSKALTDISSILSTDADAPVAVLGSMDPENVDVVVVQSTTSGSEPPNPFRSPFTARPVAASLRDVDDILLEDDETIGVEDCIAKCLAFFAARQQRTFASRTIFEWLVARSWDTLRARLQRSRDNFEHGDLFDLIENWSPAIYDDISFATIPAPPSHVYDKYGLKVYRTASGKITFSLEKSNASTLINTLGRILKDVRRTLEDDPVDFATALTLVADSLLFVSCIIEHKAVKRIFTSTTLKRVLIPAWSKGHAEIVRQALEDSLDPLTLADSNFTGEYALRYVRTITSAARAVMRISSPKILPLLADVKVTVISLLKPLSVPDLSHGVTQSVVDEIQRRLVTRPRALEEAVKWVRDLAARKLDTSSCHVHPEAGVMALICYPKSRHNVYGEHNRMAMNREVSICLAQRCCALCFRLGELLNRHLDTDHLQFLLPGTHDVVLPWDPPLFGIPKSVLFQLRDELQDKLVGLAITQGGRNADTRS